MEPKELKEWRKRNGYSQNALAKILGVAPNTVARWEQGMRERIPPFLFLAVKWVEAERTDYRLNKSKAKRRN